MLIIAKRIHDFFIPKMMAYVGFFIMSSFVVYAMVYGDFTYEGSILIGMPWGIVSLVDIYLGLIIFSFWVVWRERSISIGFIWALSIIVLGNMVSCLYLIKSIYEADGNIIKFFIGNDK